MSRVYIKFQSEADEVKGYYALATQARVDSLPGDIFGISEANLQILGRVDELFGGSNRSPRFRQTQPGGFYLGKTR